MRADVDSLRQIRPPENNTRVSSARAQGHENLLARVQAHTRGTNRVLERPLSDHALDCLFQYRPWGAVQQACRHSALKAQKERVTVSQAKKRHQSCSRSRPTPPPVIR